MCDWKTSLSLITGKESRIRPKVHQPYPELMEFYVPSETVSKASLKKVLARMDARMDKFEQVITDLVNGAPERRPTGAKEQAI